MTIYFKSRNELRAFGSKNGRKVDKGATSEAGKRWAFVITKND